MHTADLATHRKPNNTTNNSKTGAAKRGGLCHVYVNRRMPGIFMPLPSVQGWSVQQNG